ncbi:MAG: hypothetical protein U0K91_08990, partial [Acutalibacteraceae bacterium]|nr:hypothetical protein [Acutalibacteraceae bacterium]
LFVEIKKGNEVLFKSTPHVFTLIDTGETEGADIIGAATETVREECRAELAESLETATGESQEGKTWEELSEAVKEIPILTPEKQEDIDGLALVRFVIENIVFGRMATYHLKTHELFTVAPVDENNAEIDFALPYFNTYRACWQYTPTAYGPRQNYFSPRLKEIGLDCTSAVNFSETRALSIFEYFKKLKLTNVSCSLYYGFNGCTQLQTLEIYGKNGVIAPISMENTFANCKELSEILGDEFDMSGVTNASSAFANCYKLRHIRFKPFTIATSLYFGNCQTLHLSGSTDYDSLISILNGITLDREVAKNITLTFSGAITDFTTDGGFWSCNVWFQDDGTYTLEEGNSVFAEPESLYSAFISKGVTIAIV